MELLYFSKTTVFENCRERLILHQNFNAFLFQSGELIGSEEAIGARNATLEMATTEEKFSPRIRMSGTTIRPKEAILVILALALLVFSIMLFYKHWSKNYRELNTLPYYAYLYKVRILLRGANVRYILGCLQKFTFQVGISCHLQNFSELLKICKFYFKITKSKS